MSLPDRRHGDRGEPHLPTPVCELLRLDGMASGRRLLRLTRRIGADAFFGFAAVLAMRIEARIVDRAADPVLRLCLLARGPLHWRLTCERQGADTECALEPVDDAADAALDGLRRQLMARLPPLAELLRHPRRPGHIWPAESSLSEWHWLMDDLGDGGAPDDGESWVHELFDELVELRHGRRSRVCKGTDAVWLLIEDDCVRLSLALPGARHDGPVLALEEFVQGLLDWFEHSNPALALRLQDRLAAGR
jgi:hypothetical protein